MADRPSVKLTIVIIAIVVVVLGAVLLFSSESGPSKPSSESVGETRVIDKPPRAASVVLVVLDAVRSDRLGFCGYERPTSGTLKRLTGLGAVFTCDAYAPGTWTLPSHAGFFTGRELPVHKAESLITLGNQEGSVELLGNPLMPLGKELPTLAEMMKEKGYQTVSISGNPLISNWAATGLTRGFDIVVESKSFGDLYGSDLVGAVSETLASSIDRDKPVFLFINIADAHTPWRPIPKGTPGLPARSELDVGLWKPDNPFVRFMRGEMTGEEGQSFLEHARDSYDYAVFRADHTLGKIVDLLYTEGFAGPGSRLIVTSDHGEFMGEHDLLHHFTFAWEPNVRVPLLFWNGDSDNNLEMKGPISALSVFDLALEGELPKEPRPVRCAGMPIKLMIDRFGDRMRTSTAAWWLGREKLLWLGEELLSVDLEEDPEESVPSPLTEEHPRYAEFKEFVESVKDISVNGSDPSKDMIEALKALGYTE